MTGVDWELALTKHYLSADGPFGGSALTFVDANPVELAAAAAGIGVVLSEDDARENFLAQFRASDVQAWLDGRHPFVRPRTDAPGYFRYLLLTCFVSIDEKTKGDTNNFRRRLGEILGDTKSFNSVTGVNELWRDVAGWCDRQRAMGLAVRSIDLPDPGSMTMIGIALKLAFPAWRDRATFTKVMRAISAEARRSPVRLVQELKRVHRWAALPAAIRQACSEFAEQFAARNRLLRGHRFWTLVERINEQLDRAIDARTAVSWRLLASIGGYEGDEVVLSIESDDGVHGDAPAWRTIIEGAPDDVLCRIPSEQMPSLKNAHSRGILTLVEGARAQWVFTDSPLPSDTWAIVLATDTSVLERAGLSPIWRRVGPGWWLSQRLQVSSLVGVVIAGSTSRPVESEELQDLLVVGGINVGRVAKLGRPGFLPGVIASENSSVRARPTSEAVGDFRLSGSAPAWTLEADSACSGRWLLTASEGTLTTDRILTLESDAPERHSWPEDDPNFAIENEMAVVYPTASSLIAADRAASHLPAFKSVHSTLDDLMEAIYAGAPKRGWVEGDLVELLAGRLPDRLGTWEILRSLADASWIEPLVSTRWRGRKWRLVKPRLTLVGVSTAVVEGAYGAAALARLRSVTASHDGILLGAPPVDWTLPPLVVRGPIEKIAESMGWPCSMSRRPRFESAPVCWTPESRTVEGRELVGIWHEARGHFIQPHIGILHGEVILERWLRIADDDRDLFRIRGRGIDWVTTSRTAAVLEFYRRLDAPMFEWVNGRLLRSCAGGFLPLEISRYLRRSTLGSSGPTQSVDGGWTYSYPATLDDARWLSNGLGATIRLPAKSGLDWLDAVISQRRSGGRVTWPPRDTSARVVS